MTNAVFYHTNISKKEFKMKKLIILAAITLFVLTGTGIAKMGHGGSDGFKMPHGKWWRLPAIQKSLNVTPEEQKQLDQLYTASRKNMIDLKATVEKEKLELEEIMDSQTFDKKACLKQFQSLSAAKAQLATERFSFIIGIRELFGQERYLELASKRHEIKKRCARMGGSKCPALGGAKTPASGKKGGPGQTGI